MGSRRTGNGEENVYAAAKLWVDRALRADDSLFTPSEPIWSRHNLRELRQRFLDVPEVPGGGFYERLENALAGSPPEVYQLVAEVLFAHFLIIHQSAMKGDTKRDRINRVLSWSDSQTLFPDALSSGLSPGIVNPGGFFTVNPEQLGFLIELAEEVKESLPGAHGDLLNDPWQFKDFAEHLDFRSEFMQQAVNKVRMQRDAILHLVFPDTFEPIISGDHKSKLISRLAGYLTEDTNNDDRKIEQIRRGMESALGRSFYFYDSDIIRLWDPFEQGYAPSGGPLIPPSLAARLYLPHNFLEEINSLLEDKKQVIFQGPPGTGKTYVAQKLAEHIAGSKDHVTLVQFHPSYDYVDFVQGYRPAQLDNGQPGFRLLDGPLLQAAKQAEAESDAKHFLIIDEINRGNLAKVFGELYFLLEYRDSEINLQYSDKPFRLPPNLYIIGTMNTADRSIALVDLALRRRFYFVEFHPDKPPIKSLLRRYLDKNPAKVDWLADVVDRANELLSDEPHAAVGPSHFMKENLDEDKIRRIWKYGVLPYIEERLFGQDEQRLAGFDLDTLRRAVTASGASDEQEEAFPIEDVGAGGNDASD